MQSLALAHQADVKWRATFDAHSISKLVQTLHEWNRRRSAHKRRHNKGERVDGGAVTQCNIDYMYFTEESNAEERDAREGT